MRLDLIIKIPLLKGNFRTLTLEDRTLLLHAIFFLEAKATMLWPYTLNAFAEQFNEVKVDDYDITPIEKFAGTPTHISHKNQHTWGCPFYVVYETLQGNIDGLLKL